MNKEIVRDEKGRIMKIELGLKKEELFDLYINKKLSTREIAKLKGCSTGVIINRLKEFNIITRKIKHDCLKGKEKEIINYHQNEKLSCPEIGKIFDVSSVAIRNFLIKRGINTSSNGRPVSENARKNMSESRLKGIKEGRIKSNLPDMKDKTWLELYGEERTKELKRDMGVRTAKRNLINNPSKNPIWAKHISDSKKGKPNINGSLAKNGIARLTEEDIKIIINLYTKENYGTKKIGELFNLSSMPIRKILKDNNINTSSKGKNHSKEQIRKGVENRKKTIKERGYTFDELTLKKMSLSHSGEKCHFYKGGTSLGGYNWCEFNKNFRISIRERDNQVCQNCGIHREQLRRALCVHHLFYDKEINCFEGCISLCDSCHSLTNTNREYWQKLFIEKLSKLYGYKYSEDGKIIINMKEKI
jgi:predicted DNA-binding protein YlxM (UPF0122 family)/predicted HTH domain antitoxin